MFISKLTKKAIVASLVRLMSDMPLDKITVKDIVDDCDISRNTFYYNYQDIFAVIEELFEMELSSLLGAENADASWPRCIYDVCTFLSKYKSAVYSMYNSSRRDFTEKQIRRLISECVRRAVCDVSNGLSVPKADAELVVRFYTYAAEGFIKNWIETGMKEPIDSLTGSIGRVFGKSMRHIIEDISGNFSTD